MVRREGDEEGGILDEEVSICFPLFSSVFPAFSLSLLLLLLLLLELLLEELFPGEELVGIVINSILTRE